MEQIARRLLAAGIAVLSAGPLAAQTEARAGSPDSPVLRVSDTRPLAVGGAGTLTVDAADAFVDALWFSLAQVGRPTIVTPESRANLRATVAATYPALPPNDQVDLAHMRAILNIYQGAWSRLSLIEKHKFAHGVIRIAYGQAEADRVVGVSFGSGDTAGSGGGGRRLGPGGATVYERDGCHTTNFGGMAVGRMGNCN